MCADLPVCELDQDCASPGKVGICKDPNTARARCEVHDPVVFRVQILNDEKCAVCETDMFIRSTWALFPGAQFETVDIRSEQGLRLRDRYGLDRVPGFVMDAAFEKTARFDRFQHVVERVGDGFVPDIKMTAVTRMLDSHTATGLDVFVDRVNTLSVALMARLLEWMQDVGRVDDLRVHFVGTDENDRLFRLAFAADKHRAWDALLACSHALMQRRSEVSVAGFLRQAGFTGEEWRNAQNDPLEEHTGQMQKLGGRQDMMPYVVLDGQIAVSGAGLSRIERIYYQLHPDLAAKDRNDSTP